MTTSNTGLSKSAWISLGIFIALSAVVGFTRGEQRSAGIHHMQWEKLARADIKSIYIGGSSDVTLRFEAKSYEVSAGKGATSFQAEASHIDSLFEALEKTEPGAFITARKSKHSELGLSTEDGIPVEVKTSKGTRKLLLGKSTKGNVGLYAIQDGSDEVYVLGGLSLHQIKQPLDHWRKHKLFSLKPHDVKSIKMTLPNLEGKNVSWSATNQKAGQEGQRAAYALDAGVSLPVHFHVDVEAIARVASALLNARAKSFLDGDAGKIAFIHSTLLLQTHDGKSLKVSFGKADKSGDFPVSVEGDEQIYTLPGHVGRTLLKGLPSLQDTHVFRNVNVDDVVKASFRGKSGLVVVEKEGGTWMLREPAALPGLDFDSASVNGKLSSLLNLRASRVLVGQSALQKTGGPVVELTLKEATGETNTLTLSFGGVIPDDDAYKGQVSVTSSQAPLVFGIGKWQMDRYDAPLALFKKAAAAPPNMGGMGGGGMQGLENLPPELRKQLEAQLKGMNPGR
ncbi:MAG: DUF4340 domain-containing protein [Deltaproteobacteria bacterium]|nr:DUF4340 domain-containing protein [Deltaproteobacteria bacterium]